MTTIKRVLALGAAVAAWGVFAAPASAGAPPPVPQRASDFIEVRCEVGGTLNYPATPSLEGQERAQFVFNTGGGAEALGETCEVIP